MFLQALRDGIIADEDTSAVFYDLNVLGRRLDSLVAAFPASTIHTVAVKANPLRKILTHIASNGIGAEVASLPEIELARTAGIAPDRIVFDSPAKTLEELKHALSLGIYINADSLDEVDSPPELL